MMKTRKELKQAYRERPQRAGIFQVKNTVSGKVLLGCSLNLDGPLNGHKFALSTGMHRNAALQSDWNHYGAATFVWQDPPGIGGMLPFPLRDLVAAVSTLLPSTAPVR